MSEAPSKDALNHRIRQYMERRSWRPLSLPETQEYRLLVAAWSRLDEAEQMEHADVAEVA
jgi:hypothetical protein